MITINVKTNIDQWAQHFDRKYAKQMPFATAKALTHTAKDCQHGITRKLDEVFDRPTPFTQRAIGFSSANKATLTARVFVKDIQAAYLQLQVTGGIRTPKKRALVLPVNVDLNQYGNIPRRKIQQLLRRRDTFSGTVRGVPGIWQRKGRGARLLIAYEPKARYERRFPFYAIAQRIVEQRLGPNFFAAWSRAVATAR